MNQDNMVTVSVDRYRFILHQLMDYADATGDKEELSRLRKKLDWFDALPKPGPNVLQRKVTMKEVPCLCVSESIEKCRLHGAYLVRQRQRDEALKT